VKNLHIVRDAMLRTPDIERTINTDPGTAFTPGEFFRDAGTLIAVCLGLGLLTRVLLG
jgi:hypothetical protein